MATKELSEIMNSLQTEEVDNVEILAKKKNGDIVKVDGNDVATLSSTQKKSLVIGYVGLREAKPNIYYYNGNLRYISPLGYVVGENTRKYIGAKSLSFALTDGIYGIYFDYVNDNIEIAEPSLNFWNGNYWFLGVVTIFNSAIENLQMFGKYQLNGVDQHYDPLNVESAYKSEIKKVEDVAIQSYCLGFSSVNFENISNLNTNGTLGTDGKITEQGGNYCVYSDFLPLEGKQYNYFGGVYRTLANFAYYSDASESSFISSVTGTETSTSNNGKTYNGVIPRIAGAKYIRVAWNTAYEGSVSFIHSMRSLDEVIKNNASTNRFYGKKAVFLGDSITIGSWNSPSGWVNMDKPYPYWVGQILGMNVVNYGIGGTHLSGAYTSSDGSSPSQSFTNRFSSMANDADLVVVMGGTNDWLPSHTGTAPIGTIDDETDVSFYGGLNVLCKGLCEKYIGKDIVFMTPISNARQEEVNPTTNYKLVQYAKAVKEVCAKYSIPVIDANAESPMRFYVYNARLPYSNDGTHPNPTGQQMLGEFVARRLLNI